MASQRAKDAQVLNQIEWMSKTGQSMEAMSILQKYFEVPYARDWDDIYERLIRVATKLSVELLVRIPAIIKSMIEKANTAVADPLKRILLTYVQECRVRISDEQRIQSQAKQMLKIEIPKERMDYMFFKRALSFAQLTYLDVLEYLRPYDYRHDLYYKILRRSYELAGEFESAKFFDMLSSALDPLLEDKRMTVVRQISLLELLFVRYNVAIDLKMFTRAVGSLLKASEFLDSHTSPMELHEELEVDKALLLQIQEDRLPAAVQMMRLADFYETTPIDPPIPVQSLRDFALMTALASPLDNDRQDRFSGLLQEELPKRNVFVAKLLDESRMTSLKRFGVTAEEHKDAAGICLSFQAFLSEYGKRFKLPVLYKALGNYAALRIIQSLCLEQSEVDLESISRWIRWMSEFEIDFAIRQAIEFGLIKGRIDMMRGKIRILH